MNYCPECEHFYGETKHVECINETGMCRDCLSTDPEMEKEYLESPARSWAIMDR